MFQLHRSCEQRLTRPMKMEQSYPKRRHKKFRRRGMTQTKEHKAVYKQLYTQSRLSDVTIDLSIALIMVIKYYC